MTPDIYIPPPGALQFEIGEKCGDFAGGILWVVPFAECVFTIVRLPGCSCVGGDFFQTVCAQYTPRPLTLNESARGNLVCRCMGRFLE